MGNPPTLEKWKHLGIRELDLPAGGRCGIEPADMSDLIYGSPEDGIAPAVPSEFVTIAEKAEYEGVDAEKMTKEERQTLTRYRHWLVADRLRWYEHPDGSKLTSLTPQDVRSLPYEDQIAMFRCCLHMDLSERMMLASFRSQQGGATGNGSRPATRSGAK